MATILPFVIRPGARAAQRQPVGEAAAIIIFPGVRYEPPHNGGRAAQGKATRPATRKRKEKTS